MAKNISLTAEDKNFSLFGCETQIWGSTARIVIGKKKYNGDGTFDVIGATFSIKEARDIGCAIIVAAAQLRQESIDNYMNMVRGEAEKINPINCEITHRYCEVCDPYGIYGDNYQVGLDMFVRNSGSEFWVHQFDLSAACRKAIKERLAEEAI